MTRPRRESDDDAGRPASPEAAAAARSRFLAQPGDLEITPTSDEPRAPGRGARFTWQPGDLRPADGRGRFVSEPGDLTEAKAFNPNQPRDFRGRWITLGSRVRLNPISGGGSGTVTAARPGGRFDVRRDDGSTLRGVSGEYLTVIDAPPLPPVPAADEAIGASRHEGKPIADRKLVPTWDGPGELHRVTYTDGTKDWQHTPPGGEPVHYRYRSEIGRDEPAPETPAAPAAPEEPAAPAVPEAPDVAPVEPAALPPPRALRPEDQERVDDLHDAINERLEDLRRYPPGMIATDRIIVRAREQLLQLTQAPALAPESLARQLGHVERLVRGTVARQAVVSRPKDQTYADAFSQTDAGIATAAKYAIEDAFANTPLDPVKRAAAEAAVEVALHRAAEDAAARVRADVRALKTVADVRKWGRENVLSGRGSDHTAAAGALAAELAKIVSGPPELGSGVAALPRQDRPDAEGVRVLQNRQLINDVNATNPGYGMPGYDINCVHVVNAHELRRRGYATTASPIPEVLLRVNGGRNSQRALDRWRNPDGSAHGRSLRAELTFDEVERQVMEWPDGARGWVRVNWMSGDTGHIFNVEMVDGKVCYIEAQTGNTAADMARYWRQAGPGPGWGVARVDDLVPTDAVLLFVREG